MPGKKHGARSREQGAKAKPAVYSAQQKAIWRAASQLGIGLDDLRALAAQINLGIASLSSLSLQQRHLLIEDLRAKGATVRNPALNNYDLEEEYRLNSKGKVRRLPLVSTKQLAMLSALAAQVTWREHDGYLRFCHKQIHAPAPRNQREVTKLRLALQSLIAQQPCSVPSPSQGEG